MKINPLYHPKYFPTWIALFLMRCLVSLPLPIWQKIGVGIGLVLNKFAKSRRGVAEVNVDLAFPDLSPQDKDAMVKKIVINTTLGILEAFYSWWASDKDVERRSTVKNLDILEDALKDDRGVLLVGAHFSTLDLSGRVMGVRKKVDITYRAQDKNPVFNHVMNTCRQQHFKHLIEKREMRKMVRNLKKGEVVWYAPDQDFGRKGSVFAPFFGVDTATITTIGKLVKVTGAKVLFFSHFRYGTGKDTHYVGTVLDPFNDGFNDDDVNNATLLNKALEDVLRQEDPTQYFWVHKRFKTRPDPSEPSPYKKKAN
ncbi:Lipid A biosynthesis lauroyltransferase [BD1-7 clade bacterium]|uniref:Lipid A biosynthesis lauroyltransferase n=1 Tax=BD1-7 clade bacterium TaxID=2029982 RepID=A0A5S9QUQ8_9GAMM|nr:Lipid A biosynthesis lauroyltransferase [BD1-7 clade bacterium]CAA0122166.1 Lipid A biosynthesis lauroyltransferase [BD1-7 clade bacterium]